MEPRRTALGVMTTAPRGRRALPPLTAESRHAHLPALLAIAALLLALALGMNLTGRTSGPAIAPSELTGYELHQLEEVRYILWLDRTRRAGEEPRGAMASAVEPSLARQTGN